MVLLSFFFFGGGGVGGEKRIYGSVVNLSVFVVHRMGRARTEEI